MSSTLQPDAQLLEELCAERGIGHLINVTPESEVYRFGNGGLLTSTERVTVPCCARRSPSVVVLLRCGKALCYPCSLEGTLLKVSVWTSRLAAKLWNTMVDHNRWKIRWLDTIA